MHTEEKENYNLGGGSPPHGQCEKGSPLTAESGFNKADLPHTKSLLASISYYAIRRCHSCGGFDLIGI